MNKADIFDMLIDVNLEAVMEEISDNGGALYYENNRNSLTPELSLDYVSEFFLEEGLEISKEEATSYRDEFYSKMPLEIDSRFTYNYGVK